MLTFYLTTEDETWDLPPHNYADVATALMNALCIIGAVIGCIYAGYLSDKFVLYMAK